MCTVNNCGKEATATIYCQMHYRRLRLYGDVDYVLREQRRQSGASNITLMNDHALVELTQGKSAIIDLEDVENINRFNWNFSATTGYAYSGKIGTSLHQYLMGKAPDGYKIDHNNRDKLDCRRRNLHFVTNQQNSLNNNRSTNYSGISLHLASGKFQTYLRKNCRQIYLGVFRTYDEAAKMKELASEMFDKSLSEKEFKTSWKLMRKRKADTEKADE
jgi:hypothetical protein